MDAMENALDDFIGAHVAIRDTLRRIQEKVDAYQDRLTPEEVRWTHAGDLSHVLALLLEVEAFLDSSPNRRA